jgi:hypothetical protein
LSCLRKKNDPRRHFDNNVYWLKAERNARKKARVARATVTAASQTPPLVPL